MRMTATLNLSLPTRDHRKIYRKKFFQDGERLDEAHLPDWMQTDEMRQAMSTLKAFSEKERAYHACQARQNYLREQRSIQRYLGVLQADSF
jgi:hypothetical protein